MFDKELFTHLTCFAQRTLYIAFPIKSIYVEQSRASVYLLRLINQNRSLKMLAYIS